MRWCTVTVTDQDGRRHSVDVQATSTFDAAHLFVVEAKKERAVGLPKPTLATVFEVVTSRQGIPRRRRCATTMDRRAPTNMERPERLSVRPAPWTGVTDGPGKPDLGATGEIAEA